MATLDQLSEFFPSLIAARAAGKDPENLRKALVEDVEGLRAQGMIGPLEPANSMALITKTVPPRIHFNEDNAAVRRLLMMGKHG